MILYQAHGLMPMISIRQEAANSMHEARRTTSQAFFYGGRNAETTGTTRPALPTTAYRTAGRRSPGAVHARLFTASDTSTRSLRRYFKLLGYDARGWGLGRNSGDVARLAPSCRNRGEMSAASGSKVSLVGWSMGICHRPGSGTGIIPTWFAGSLPWLANHRGPTPPLPTSWPAAA